MSKVALITGATRGIGFEIGRQLADHGMHVVIGSRSPADGDKAAARIRGHSGTATSLFLDVRDSDNISAAAQAFSRVSDHLDVLVNNAGIYPDKNVSILAVSRDHLTTTLHTNTLTRPKRRKDENRSARYRYGG